MNGMEWNGMEWNGSGCQLSKVMSKVWNLHWVIIIVVTGLRFNSNRNKFTHSLLTLTLTLTLTCSGIRSDLVWMLRNRWMWLSPMKGGRPAIISNKTVPTHDSCFDVGCFRRHLLHFYRHRHRHRHRCWVGSLLYFCMDVKTSSSWFSRFHARALADGAITGLPMKSHEEADLWCIASGCTLVAIIWLHCSFRCGN